MKSSDYQRTRWLVLVGAIITQFALGSVSTGACSMARFPPGRMNRLAW